MRGTTKVSSGVVRADLVVWDPAGEDDASTTPGRRASASRSARRPPSPTIRQATSRPRAQESGGRLEQHFLALARMVEVADVADDASRRGGTGAQLRVGRHRRWKASGRRRCGTGGSARPARRAPAISWRIASAIVMTTSAACMQRFSVRGDARSARPARRSRCRPSRSSRRRSGPRRRADAPGAAQRPPHQRGVEAAVPGRGVDDRRSLAPARSWRPSRRSPSGARRAASAGSPRPGRAGSGGCRRRSPRPGTGRCRRAREAEAGHDERLQAGLLLASSVCGCAS